MVYNNAASYAMSPFLDLPLTEHLKTVQVNTESVTRVVYSYGQRTFANKDMKDKKDRNASPLVWC